MTSSSLGSGSSNTRRALVHAAAITPLAIFSLACLTTVEGERSMTGMCPAGEVCSEATPRGLTFIGRALFDQGETPRLGPIVEGGTLAVGMVGLVGADGETPIAHSARVEDGSVLAVRAGQGVFGPHDDEGRALFPVDDHVEILGVTVGRSTLRVVDPATLELLDRTELSVVGVDDVRVVSATDPDRGHLLAGCDEMVGIELLSGQEGIEVRAIDDSMTVRAEGTVVSPEPQFWDCVRVTPARGATEMQFEIRAGGRDYVRSMPVRTLAEEGLASCPVQRD